MKVLFAILIGSLLIMWCAVMNAVDANDLGLDEECLCCDKYAKYYTDVNGEKKWLCSECPKFHNSSSPFDS